MYTPSLTETIENPPPTSKPIGGGNNATFEPSSSTPFSPTEHAVQLQYPPPESKSNPSDTYISEQVPVSKPVTALIEPPELKPAVAASGQPSSNSPPKTDIKDPKSLHLPHLHVPSMFHDKSDPIHKVNEYDVDGYKAEKAFLWSCIGSLCLCLFGCWCIPWIPFVFVHTKYSRATSARARRYSQLAKITWIVILISLLSVLLLGILVAIVVPSVYSVRHQKV